MILLRSLSIPAFKHLHQVELAFPRAGSVLIEGPNESGKSTLFEAIYFALYGAPLAGDGDSTSLESLLPHGGGAATVALTLLADDTTLEIQRTVSRPSDRSGARQGTGSPVGQGSGNQGAATTARQDARLLVRRPGARAEEIVETGMVNDRILAELHGLDGDALRTSCFMEQGALEQVEALSRSAREDAIAKLLGLERLVGIEHDLTPTPQDHAALDRARIELAVAERSRMATEAERRETEATTALRAARVRSLLAQRDALAAQHAEHEQVGQAMRDHSGELEGHIARAGQVAALLASLDAVEPDLAAGREAEATAAQHRAGLAELDRIEYEHMPAAQGRLGELHALEADLASVEQARGAVQVAQQRLKVAELDERLSQLDHLIPALTDYDAAQRELALTHEAHRLARNEENARAAVAQGQAALEQAQADARQAQAAVDRANLRDILAYWVRLKEIEALKRSEQQVAQITRQRDGLAAKVARLHRREVMASVIALLGALTAAATAFAYVKGLAAKPFPILIVTVVSVILVWIVAIIFGAAMFGGRRTERTLRETERRLTLASIRTEAANLLGGSIEDLPQVEADLRSAGAGVPESVEVGRAQLASLTAAEPASLADLEDTARDVLLRAERLRVELANTQTQLESARHERAERGLLPELPLAAIEERLSGAERNAATAETTARDLVVVPFTWPVERAAVQAANAELAGQRAQAAGSLGIGGDEMLALAEAQSAVQEARARLQAQVNAAEARRVALGLPADATAVAAARGATESEVARWQDQLREREALAAQLATHDDRAASSRAALSPAVLQAWQTATALAVLPPDAQPSEHADIASVARDRATVRQAATTTLDQLDERGRREELASLRAQLSAHTDRTSALAQQREDTQGQLRALLAEQGTAAQGNEPLETLAQAWPLLAQVGPDEVEIRERARADASREAHFARRTAEDLAQTHGYDAAQLALLDEGQARARAEEAERTLRQRELATSMARDVRTRIVRQVLPETELFMRELLPALTLGRYRDVRLLRDEASANGADLRVRVWDEAAGRYVGKSLFSGGAQDQCSLALRLAFALATLPKELGARPGFIFLDEPLSSFDAERSQALVRVLTQGVISQQFAQIFLISHSQSIDPTQFRYALRLQDGAVVDSTLPGPREAAQQWEAGAIPARATVTG